DPIDAGPRQRVERGIVDVFRVELDGPLRGGPADARCDPSEQPCQPGGAERRGRATADVDRAEAGREPPRHPFALEACEIALDVGSPRDDEIEIAIRARACAERNVDVEPTRAPGRLSHG